LARAIFVNRVSLTLENYSTLNEEIAHFKKVYIGLGVGGKIGVTEEGNSSSNPQKDSD